MKVLVCAATRAEAKACAKGIADARLRASFEVLETGVGLERAKLSLERRLRSGARPCAVISSGFAGAFSRGLAPLSWITSDEVLRFEKGMPASRRSMPPLAANEALVCRIVSAAELVVAHDEAGSGSYEALQAPVVVDMETASLAEVCAREHVPLAVLRMITDTPEKPLPQFLASVAAAMAETRTRARFTHGLTGFRKALRDPMGVAHVARHSTAWLAGLRRGWAKNAPSVWNYCGKLDCG